MRSMSLWVAGLGFAALASAQVQFNYDADSKTWTGENGVLRVAFQLTDAGLCFRRIENLRNGDSWSPPPGEDVSLVRLQVNDEPVDVSAGFELLAQSVQATARGGMRQMIALQDAAPTGRIQIELELYPDQPVLRHRVRYRNLRSGAVYLQAQDFLPWAFDATGHRFRTFRVRQWSAGGSLGNFETERTTLEPDGDWAAVFSGAYGQYCAWLALRDEVNRGLFAGWEFDGRAVVSLWQTGSPEALRIGAEIVDFQHPLAANQEFAGPWAFLGVFRGDWEEAGYRTQRFSETVLARPLPDERFPWVIWDSWGYGENIDEIQLRREAQLAAKLGVEAFVLDLGWARRIGDWQADVRKFPSGLRAFSDYVHSLGMKFGLHFPFAEAAPESAVLQQNPDWTSSQSYGYFGALSLCLSHRPVRDWVVAQALRMIDDYNVDWMLQDGENMVKECTKLSHTHDRQDSNYANAVHGLNWVVSSLLRQRPRVLWENCEDGGNMMTFGMVRRYVTSIAADNTDALRTRQAMYGATYPFSPRYVEGYMPEERLDPYITRSYMFTGPWVLMNRLTRMSAADLDLLAREIGVYKRVRGRIREGKVFHLFGPPAPRRWDAIESYDPATNSALAFVYRAGGGPSERSVALRGLDAQATYSVSFEGEPGTATYLGQDLLKGLRIQIPATYGARIVYVDPVQ